jgi:hypothetical protein
VLEDRTIMAFVDDIEDRNHVDAITIIVPNSRLHKKKRGSSSHRLIEIR